MEKRESGMTVSLMKDRTKKQHYVPKFYLDRFTDTDGRIHTYDRNSDKVFSNTPSETGAETNFYSFQDENGKWNDNLENLLSTLESEAALLFDDLIGGKVFRGTEREILSNFVAFQYFRSPVIIAANADMAGQLAYKTALIASTASEETGDNKIKQVDSDLLDPENIELNVLKKMGVNGIMAAPKVAGMLYQATWVITRIQDQHLLTSDSPAVKTYDPKTYSVYGDGGFANKTMYVTLPLSPETILSIGWWDVTEGGVHAEQRERGRLYNRQRVYSAERYIYSSRIDDGVSRLVRKSKNHDYRPRILVDGDTPKINLKRRID